MTVDKDFKRLVRGRMRKTGEAYTAARAALLSRKERPAPPEPEPVAPPPSAPEYARLAGMSDAVLKARTGCTWDKWVYVLDRVGAHEWPHREIARYVSEHYRVPDWWVQTVTVGYERIKGLRAIGQRRDGSFEASRSRTFPVAISRLYRACSDRRTRARWLPGVGLTVRTATRDRSLRMTWPDGTAVQLWFTAKGPERSQVQVQHARLPDRAAADRLKGWWGERLDALAGVLDGRRAGRSAH